MCKGGRATCWTVARPAESNLASAPVFSSFDLPSAYGAICSDGGQRTSVTMAGGRPRRRRPDG